jgi:hypothetical protein
MNILTANLKFFYQRPALWLVYGFMVLISLPLIGSALDHKFIQTTFFPHVYFVSIYSGWICASLWKEALGKPFSFSLPKSRHVPGKVILIAGTVINLLVSLLYSSGRHPETFFLALQIFLPIFFTGMSLFLIAALTTFQANKSVRNFFVFFIFSLFLFSSVSREIESILISHPLIVTLFGMGLVFFTWFRMGQRELRRKLCLTPSLGLFDAWNQNKTKRVREQMAAQKLRPSDERWRDWLENFFLGRMKQYDVMSVGRNVWGYLYLCWGYPGIRLGRLILIVALLIGFYSYCLQKSMQGIIFAFPAAMAGMGFPLPLKHSMLLPVGRKEHFGTAMILMPVYTILVIAALAVVGAFWQGLYILVPHVTISGRTYTCNPFEWTFLYTPLFFLPICLIFRRFLARYTILLIMVLMGTTAPFSMFLFPWLTQKGLWINLALIAVSWVLCFLAYRDYFRRANLVGQGRG